MNKIQVESLKKSYHGTVVLKEVSFAAKAGEVVTLLGDSGAGKSTLLRCLNLLEMPDEGRMVINDLKFHFSLTAKKPTCQSLVALRNKLGMVFQQFHLWAHRTILQNLIEAPCQVLKISKAEAVKKAECLLDQIGILAKKDDYPVRLSGGQQQRAAIARALMMEPEVMLFDEPTSALDPKMITAMRDLIHELAQKGMTIVIATHEMKFAREVAHKTVFLHEGRIVEEGQPEIMFHSPKTQVFSDFIESLGD
ncbi:amino acid ABC transporter ATP-binding protein [Coxiella endosymbiont of Ornithodoros maritimus]|uniref:amino acid ABC transporter ATP-binding protein n=1 Tax=Coxiella endosymbiont of Ornithodoros maritimus TaxID=1656172 RepID=UPI002263EE17|nr:amino acid ABC transporter ATP-binding protein [Coxiella endosymbiont of Ornithodoros maritimus]